MPEAVHLLGAKQKANGQSNLQSIPGTFPFKHIMNIHLLIHVFPVQMPRSMTPARHRSKWRQSFQVWELIWPLSLAEGYKSYCMDFITLLRGDTGYLNFGCNVGLQYQYKQKVTHCENNIF